MTRTATRSYDQITIRVEPEVGRRLRSAAAKRRVPVARVVDEALRIATGLDAPASRPDALPRIGDRLDWLAGTMSDAEADAILAAVSAHETIDDAFWAPKRKRGRN